MSGGISEVLDGAQGGAGARELEEEVCELAASLGRALLSGCMAGACKRATDDDIERRRLEPGQVLMRLDRDFWATQMTTLGPIVFPLFAYRERRPGGSVTRTPARAEVVPLLGRCRSSELCLQWEARLGKDLPFRTAQEALSFLSHGTVRQEDTTLAAHMVAAGGAIDRTWLYLPLDELRDILTQRATRDAETGPPVLDLYHALQRLKRSGARWLPRTARAVVNLRLLDRVGRWDEFWADAGLQDVPRAAFAVPAAEGSP